MTNDTDFMPGIEHEDAFEVQMRGYSRRQVDEFVAKSRGQVRDLEERLTRSLDEIERLRLELSTARQGQRSKPTHEEISERVGQILKLADEEAKAQRIRTAEEAASERDEAKKEADRFRAEAREHSERMLTAAQEQAEHSIVTARAEAEKMRGAARTESERVVSTATKEAETTLGAANAQAKQMLDEATLRATAIHDGAERRLTMLTARHTETMRRLVEIRDVVTNVVASETSRGSLEDEVASALPGGAGAPGAARTSAAEGRHVSGGRAAEAIPGQERRPLETATVPSTPAPPASAGPLTSGQHAAPADDRPTRGATGDQLAMPSSPAMPAHTAPSGGGLGGSTGIGASGSTASGSGAGGATSGTGLGNGVPANGLSGTGGYGLPGSAAPGSGGDHGLTGDNSTDSRGLTAPARTASRAATARQPKREPPAAPGAATAARPAAGAREAVGAARPTAATHEATQPREAVTRGTSAVARDASAAPRDGRLPADETAAPGATSPAAQPRSRSGE